MPMAQIQTHWTADELFQQAIAHVSDDPNWMVQAQAPQSLVLRREKNIALWKILVLGFFVLITFGLALIFLPVLFIGFQNQQIALSTKPSDGKTAATITYTTGAKSRVMNFIQAVPRA